MVGKKRALRGQRWMGNRLWGERKGMGMKRALHSPAIKWAVTLPRTQKCWTALAEIWTVLDLIAEQILVWSFCALYFITLRENVPVLSEKKKTYLHRVIHLSSLHWQKKSVSRCAHFSFAVFESVTKEHYAAGYVTATEHRGADNRDPFKSLH